MLAAHSLGGSADIAYSVDGNKRTAKSDPAVINPDAAQVERGLKVRNDADHALWLQVTARGVPKEPQPPASNGLSITRRYYTLDGREANLATVRQNDRIVVSLGGRNLDNNYHEVALLDLLPAGFEIESVVNDETVKSFPFLGKITPTRMAEARDDRFFAAFDLGKQLYRSWWDEDKNYYNVFNVAYVVRAVTPGSFALPAVNVSDMYAPRIYARSDMGRVTIAPK